MSAWTTIENFFENLWTNDLKPEVQTTEQVAVSFVSAGVSDLASQLGIAGIKVVTDAVMAAENTGGSGAAKLAAAVASASANFVQLVMTVPAHILNFAIEAAVAQLNAAKAAAAVAAPVEPPA